MLKKSKVQVTSLTLTIILLISLHQRVMKAKMIDKVKRLSLHEDNITESSRLLSNLKKVYEFLKLIPSGKVVTYGQLIKTVGHPGTASTISKKSRPISEFNRYSLSQNRPL